MTGSQGESVELDTSELFDRYTLPKVALTIILVASLIGTYLSLTLVGVTAMYAIFLKWMYFVSLAVLVGGLCWKHVFVRPQDLNSGTDAYCTRMYDRFDRIAILTLFGLIVSGPFVLHHYWLLVPGMTVPTIVTASFGLLLVALVTVLARPGTVAEQFRSPLGLSLFAVALSVLVATAVAEVSLGGGTTGSIVVRTLHLLAFAIWLGGAVWNIFVAVPTGQESPTIPVVSAAGQQLERFRWAVRLIIPTIILTGLYQSYVLFGTDMGAYLQSTLGLAIVAKLGFIGVLVVIFKLCPMWRACSPIEGVCDLEETEHTAHPDGVEAPSDD